MSDVCYIPNPSHQLLDPLALKDNYSWCAA